MTRLECPCGDVFEVYPCRAETAKYCSAECRVRYRDYSPNAGQFVPGLNYFPAAGFQKGQRPTNWKGEEASYSSLHKWVRLHMGSASDYSCYFCWHDGSTYQLTWANESGKYKRNLSDWIVLCVPCHRIHDRETGSVFDYFEKMPNGQPGKRILRETANG